MNFLDYIVSEAYILIPVLYILGTFLKETPKVPDFLIPWILLICGMAGGFFLAGMKWEGILQGILVTGATVLTNQLYKQTANRKKDPSSAQTPPPPSMTPPSDCG